MELRITLDKLPIIIYPLTPTDPYALLLLLIGEQTGLWPKISPPVVPWILSPLPSLG